MPRTMAKMGRQKNSEGVYAYIPYVAVKRNPMQRSKTGNEKGKKEKKKLPQKRH